MSNVKEITTHPPTRNVPSNRAFSLSAIAASASGTKEIPILTAKHTTLLEGVRITPAADIVVTDQTTAGVLFLNRRRANVQIGYDGAAGAFPFLIAGTASAHTPIDVSAVGNAFGSAWYGYLTGAVTAAVSTGGTLAKFGSSALAFLESTAILNGGTTTLVVDPGLTTQETIVISAYNTGTGVFTIAASGTFANSHSAGALVVTQGALLWAGTSTAATVSVSTGTTLTATSPSLLTTLIGVGAQLVFEPFTSNVESVPVATINTGTGAFTIASSYNGGVFAKAHANGATVGILLGNQLQILRGEVLTARWVQSATTGLAVPVGTLLEVFVRPAGS